MSSLNELGIIPECDIARADELARQHAEIEALKAERDALLEALKFIADHDLRGADLTVAGHIAHALIGKARAALKEAT